MLAERGYNKSEVIFDIILKEERKKRGQIGGKGGEKEEKKTVEKYVNFIFP